MLILKKALIAPTPTPSVRTFTLGALSGFVTEGLPDRFTASPVYLQSKPVSQEERVFGQTESGQDSILLAYGMKRHVGVREPLSSGLSDENDVCLFFETVGFGSFPGHSCVSLTSESPPTQTPSSFWT